MTMQAPHVYIGTERMNDYALAKIPMLAGLTFNWGTDSQTDFDDPATMTAQLLVREPSNLDFLVKGAEVGVLDPGSGETLFAGRISTLRAKREKRKKNALLITMTCTDTLADLNNYRVERVEWLAPAGQSGAWAITAARRREQLRSALPAGWTLEGATSHDWTFAREQRWEGHAYTPLLDMHCRSTVARRHLTSRYVPGTGLVNRITITNERAKASPTETLAARSNGNWYMSTAAPVNSGVARLESGHVENSIEWEKTPDDTITDVALTTWGITYENDSTTGQLNTETSKSSDMWVGNQPGVNMGPMQRTYGFHGVTFDVDTLGVGGGGTSPHIANIVNYWLDADTLWRPTTVSVPDSRRLPDTSLLNLLSATRRYLVYLTISGLPENNPAGFSRVRGFVLAGEATWTGKKWAIELTLGRVPRPAAGAGGLTFNSIRNHSTPAISAGTAETIGTELTFADFQYIGA